MTGPEQRTDQPPRWSDFLARLSGLTDPHSIRGAHLEYWETVLPGTRVEYTPRDLAAMARETPRWLPSTEAFRLEGLPFRGGSALLDDMLLISGRAGEFAEHHPDWMTAAREQVQSHLRRVQALPPAPDEHPVTRLGREPLFHQCVSALSAESKIVFHGLFLSVDGFSNRWPEANGPEGDKLLLEVAAMLRDTHPPRSALFHLSHAFFAALSLGPTRRQYRKLIWDLRHLMLRRGFLPDWRLNLSIGVIFWPTDACFPGPFCDILLASLNKARRKGKHSMVFTEDWYRNPFAR